VGADVVLPCGNCFEFVVESPTVTPVFDGLVVPCGRPFAPVAPESTVDESDFACIDRRWVVAAPVVPVFKVSPLAVTACPWVGVVCLIRGPRVEAPVVPLTTPDCVWFTVSDTLPLLELVVRRWCGVGAGVVGVESVDPLGWVPCARARRGVAAKRAETSRTDLIIVYTSALKDVTHQSKAWASIGPIALRDLPTAARAETCV
jgi:hypothetical protein